MAAPFAFFAARQRPALPLLWAGSASAPARGARGWGRGSFRLGSRHVLLAIAVGSVVAVLWSRAVRRRGATSPPASPARHVTIRPFPLPPGTSRRSSSAGLNPAAANVRTAGVEIVAVSSEPRPGASIRAPWVHRVAVAVCSGWVGELRRIAFEMERAGLDMEAGLLKNYAQLLERSRVSRPRVLTEVTRMLQAAAAHRRATPAAALEGPVGAPAAARTPAALRATSGPAAKGPAAKEPAAKDLATRPLIPMPILRIEARRRAAR